jgi:hypothetical protein
MAAFRRGVMVGLATGYVLGAKAGRERYDQIQKVYGRLKRMPAFQKVTAKASAVVGLGIERGKLVVLDEIEKATRTVRGRVNSSAKTRIFD